MQSGGSRPVVRMSAPQSWTNFVQRLRHVPRASKQHKSVIFSIMKDPTNARDVRKGAGVPVSLKQGWRYDAQTKLNVDIFAIESGIN
jgi:hypothetical protein